VKAPRFFVPEAAREPIWSPDPGTARNEPPDAICESLGPQSLEQFKISLQWSSGSPLEPRTPQNDFPGAPSSVLELILALCSLELILHFCSSF